MAIRAPRIGFVAFFVATLGELYALTAWLACLDGAPRHLGWLAWPVALGMNPSIAAGALLLAGFIIERGAVAYWLRFEHAPRTGINSGSLPATIGGLALATAIELLIWWLFRYSAHTWTIEIAGLFLFVTIHALHAAELAGVRQQPIIRTLVRPKTLAFSLAEAVGGSLWLGLSGAQPAHPYWGILALGLGLFLEHSVQGHQLAEQDFRPLPAARRVHPYAASRA